MTESMIRDLLMSVVFGAITMLAGFVVVWIQNRQRKLNAHEEKKLDTIAKTVEAELNLQKTVLLEKATKNVAGHYSDDQLRYFSEEIKNAIAAIPDQHNPEQTAVETLISNYHEQALGQTKVQFWFSLVAACAGLLWILYAGLKIIPQQPSSTWAILPGVVIDAVAFLFFRQASETRKRATELYDRLRIDRQLRDSASRIASIDDPRVRNVVNAQIALQMSGLQPTPIDLSRFLSIASNSIDNDEAPEKLQESSAE